MQSDEQSGVNTAIALVTWVTVFFVGWDLVEAISRSRGLALVLGVFLALLAFHFARHSFRAGIALIVLSLLWLAIKGTYLLFS
jgi:VIT1/CCC1 family predicted Fe2+/Mn2+ transporter